MQAISSTRMSQTNFKSKETFECVICSTSIENEHAIAILACHHKFHLGCVISFITSQNDSYCPNCDKSVELNPFQELKDQKPKPVSTTVAQRTTRLASRPRRNARKQRGPHAFLQMMFNEVSPENQENGRPIIARPRNGNRPQELPTTRLELQMVSVFGQLYKKICQAEARSEYQNQEAVMCYYRFGEALSKRMTQITNDGTPLQMARSKLNKEVRQQLSSDVSDFTLRKKIEKARKIYDIFNILGVDKIYRIGYFTADAISRLTRSEIQYILDVASVEYKIKLEPDAVQENA